MFNKKPISIGCDMSSGPDYSAIATVITSNSKPITITSTPRGHCKTSLFDQYNLHNTNLCQEVQLSKWPKEENQQMRINQQRLHDKIIECVALIRKEQPQVLERILECSEAARKEMPNTGMHVLTRFINITEVRKSLSVLFQARAVKYALYCIFMETWILHTDEWDQIRQALNITFSSDKRHVREAIFYVIKPRAVLMGKTKELDGLITNKPKYLR